MAHVMVLNSKLKMDGIEKRFWEKVTKGAGCWEWKTAKDKDGYGLFSLTHSKQEKAHRRSWTIENGKIPKGLWILHHCDNPPCVRPDHLFLGTAKDNKVDSMQKGRLNPTRGEKSAQAKLTNELVLRMREVYANGQYTYKELGNMFGMSKSHTGGIIRKDFWKHI